MALDILSALATKLAAAGLATATATTGVLAATGNLPADVQQQVAEQVAELGIELPTPDDGTTTVTLTDVTTDDAAPASVERPADLPEVSRADDVHAVIDATAPEDRGAEFGRAVAEAASDGRAGGSEEDETSTDETSTTDADADETSEARRDGDVRQDDGAPDDVRQDDGAPDDVRQDDGAPEDVRQDGEHRPEAADRD